MADVLPLGRSLRTSLSGDGGTLRRWPFAGADVVSRRKWLCAFGHPPCPRPRRRTPEFRATTSGGERRIGPALEAMLRWLIPTLGRFPRRKRFLLGDRIQTTAFLGPLTSWERGLPAREPPEPPAFLRPRTARESAMRAPEDVLPLPGGGAWKPAVPGRPALPGARGPGLSFVCNQDETGGRPLLTAGTGASCEEGTFLASRGQVSENGVRSFHFP